MERLLTSARAEVESSANELQAERQHRAELEASMQHTQDRLATLNQKVIHNKASKPYSLFLNTALL
jgi:septal ring factor EnvC (AmiA/AmiB activator)